MTNLLFALLHRKKSFHYFPKDILEKDYTYHWNLVNKFKEIYWRWILEDREIVKRCTFWVHDKGDKPNKEITINCSDCLQVTLLSIFYPELIEAVQIERDKHMLSNLEYFDLAGEIIDPEDAFDDILQALAEQAQSRYGTQNQKKEGEQDAEEIIKKSKEIIESMYEVLTLEQIICKSILSIKNIETRKKMASKILLTGGVIWAKEYIDLIDIIEDRLIHYITQEDNSIEKVDVIQVKDQDPRFFTWIGGAVWSRLDVARDMFIEREQWSWTFKNFENHWKEEKIRRIKEKDLNEIRNNQAKKDEEEDEEDIKNSETDSKAFSKQQKINEKKPEKKQKKEEKKDDRETLELDEKDIVHYLRKERNLDSGFKILREKVPFQW